MRKLFSIQTGAMLAAFCLFSVSVHSEEQEREWGLEVGSEIPELSVKNIDGDELTIDDLRGESKGLLLFFCTTMEPHRTDFLLDLQEDIERFRQLGLEVAAISYNQVDKTSDDSNPDNLDYAILSDQEFSTARAFEIFMEERPEDDPIGLSVFLIDPNDKVAFKEVFALKFAESDKPAGAYHLFNKPLYEPSLEELLNSLEDATLASNQDTDTIDDSE
ncbi:MAG: redoxin domain-containing protein [Gammaproteobacteria bacterium]|nr:redoxin domain-containing protein [Gammaproteobacteria bacterium]